MFFYTSEMNIVGPASLVPWVSCGYLRVKTQLRCIKWATFVASWSHLTEPRKKVVMTKQRRCVQMRTFPREALWRMHFIDFPAESALGCRGLTLAPFPQIFTPFRRMGCRQQTGPCTVSAMSFCQCGCAPASCFSTLTAVFHLHMR